MANRLDIPSQPTNEQVKELIDYLTSNMSNNNQFFIGVSFTMIGSMLKEVKSFHFDIENKKDGE